MKVLSNTTTTTKAVLQAVSDGQWWKKSLTYLRPLQGQKYGGAYQIGTTANEDLEKQGCHPFYESVISNPLVTESEVTYDTYQHVPVESFAEVLLRTGKLAEAKNKGEEVFPTTEGKREDSSSLTYDRLSRQLECSALGLLLHDGFMLDSHMCTEAQSGSIEKTPQVFYGCVWSLQLKAQTLSTTSTSKSSILTAEKKSHEITSATIVLEIKEERFLSSQVIWRMRKVVNSLIGTDQERCRSYFGSCFLSSWMNCLSESGRFTYASKPVYKQDKTISLQDF
ncbi:hypothetical protein P7K49_028555 [Saguinus oedipus]|uniref:Uncharacterized protein n=1 Tax=Saguinus oedipus TaxID=9490 RepID=A0ABQ9U4N6_SAGOE|nr:hypothetical protein P7K49_028555 [Saguinus oedipus]